MFTTGVARIFPVVHLPWPKNWWPFFRHHPLLQCSYTSYTATNYHFISSGSAPLQIQPHFCLLSTKMPRKNVFSIALGVHLHPCILPGYVYDVYKVTVSAYPPHQRFIEAKELNIIRPNSWSSAKMSATECTHQLIISWCWWECCYRCRCNSASGRAETGMGIKHSPS